MPSGPEELPIVIAGVPPGVKVGVFDETRPKGDDKRIILLQEADSEDYLVQTAVPQAYAGVEVKVVIRAAGFLPVQFTEPIHPRRGLLHAARLEVDRIYEGPRSGPATWETEKEHRRAQRVLQDITSSLPIPSPEKPPPREGSLSKYKVAPAGSFERFHNAFVANASRGSRFIVELKEGQTASGIPVSGTLGSTPGMPASFTLHGDDGELYLIPFGDLVDAHPVETTLATLLAEGDENQSREIQVLVASGELARAAEGKIDEITGTFSSSHVGDAWKLGGKWRLQTADQLLEVSDVEPLSERLVRISIRRPTKD